MLKRLLIAVVAITTMLIATPVPNLQATVTSVPAFTGKVYVIVGENTSLSQLTMRNAPYQLGTLQADGAWLTDYWGISHYSTSNYIAMTSGQFLKCHQLDEKPATCNQDVTNIFGQLEAAGISWAAWNESMPAPCYLVNAGENRFGNAYRPKHNPAVYYQDIAGTNLLGTQGDVSSGSPCNNVIPMGSTSPNDTTAFESRVEAGNVPTFNYIVPNMCEDGHDNCKPQGNTIKQFDDFLRREITAIQSSASWQTGKDLIVVVYDEGQDGGPGKAVKFAGGHVPFVVLGANVHPGTYTDTANHYNLLRTLEEGFKLTYPNVPSASAGPILKIWDPAP